MAFGKIIKKAFGEARLRKAASAGGSGSFIGKVASVVDRPAAGRSSGGFTTSMAANNTTKRKQAPTNDLIALSQKIVKSK